MNNKALKPIVILAVVLSVVTFIANLYGRACFIAEQRTEKERKRGYVEAR